MKLLVPMDCDDTQEAQLVKIFDVKKWATIEIEEGQVVEINFYDTKEEIEDWLDAVVVANDFEPVMEFMEDQMMVLVAHTQRTVDDIVEAYLFRELHQMAV